MKPDYSGELSEITLNGVRFETDEEFTVRIEREKESQLNTEKIKAQWEAKEKQEYERLKAKFENGKI